MSNPFQTQRIIKGHLSVFYLSHSFTLSLSLSLSLSYIFFFFLDFSLKFVWHKNFEGVPDFA